MAERTLTYFVSDVHLGLATKDPREREDRFVEFLRSLPREKMAALWLLGDIWDFWYEYRDVIPRYGIRIVSELIQLMSEGIEVCFIPGNHDIWCYSFFESIGIHKVKQPYHTQIGGKDFCLGHGDCLGGAPFGYRFMLSVFRCRPVQVIFSTLHPYLAYRFGLAWSQSTRRKHKPYHFRGENEPLYKFCVSSSEKRRTDFFIFGHFHDGVDMALPSGGRLLVLKDWMDGGCPCVIFDSSNGECSANF